jgi:hypothetical protein
MSDYQALLSKLILIIGKDQLNQALQALYYYIDYDDMGELHKANDLFTTLARDATIKHPTLTIPITSFIIGIYMNAMDIPEDVAYTYVQKNIMNNTLH